MQRDLDVIKTTIREGDSKEDRMLSGLQVKYLSRIEAASDRAISPLQDIEDTLGDLVNSSSCLCLPLQMPELSSTCPTLTCSKECHPAFSSVS